MNCLYCDKDLAGKRVDARFCDDSCKKRWQRKQKPSGKRGRPRKSSGLPGGPSSTSSPSVPDQGPDAPPVVHMKRTFIPIVESEDYQIPVSVETAKMALEVMKEIEAESKDRPTDVGFESDSGINLTFPTCLHPGIIIPEYSGEPPVKEQQFFPEVDPSKWADKEFISQANFTIPTHKKPKPPTVHARTKALLLAKAGNPEGSSSPSGGKLPPVPDAPPFNFSPLSEEGRSRAKLVSKEEAQDKINQWSKAVSWKSSPHLVENHGSANDLARQMILRVKPPVVSDLSKSQLPVKKGE